MRTGCEPVANRLPTGCQPVGHASSVRQDWGSTTPCHFYATVLGFQRRHANPVRQHWGFSNTGCEAVANRLHPGTGCPNRLPNRLPDRLPNRMPNRLPNRLPNRIGCRTGCPTGCRSGCRTGCRTDCRTSWAGQSCVTAWGLQHFHAIPVRQYGGFSTCMPLLCDSIAV